MNFQKHWAASLDDYVIDLAWSPNGATLAVASTAGGITLFDATTGTARHTLAGHEDGTNALAWLPADARQAAGEPPPSPSLLASGGQDGSVRLWDATTGRQTAGVSLGSAWVEHLAWRAGSSPLLFAAAGKKLFALSPDGTMAHRFPDAPKTITSLAITAPSPASDQAPILAAAYFGGVCLWESAAFTVARELPYGNAIHALVWSPDGRWLVAGCQDNAVHLWVPGEELEFQMSGYETKLKELAFSHDSRWLATGGGRDACIWDCAGAGPEGREPTLLPHKARVCAVAFQNQHSLLVTGASDGEFCLWATSRKNPLLAEVKMPAAVTRFSWRPDDSLLAVGTEKGSVFVFKVEH